MNIIVAGASQGIGFEVVKKLAEEGNHRIIVLARTAEKLEDLVNEVEKINAGATVLPCVVDLEKPDFERVVVPFVNDNFQNVDVLLYNAGLLISKPFSGLDHTDFDRMFNVNVKGAFILIRVLLPLFSEGSHIVTSSSMGGFQGSAKFPGLSLYSASKGALAVLTECMAEEFKEKGVKCNSLALGAVQTEMLSKAFPGYTAPLMPEQMAAFIADFALNGHTYFNGKILPISLSTP